MALILLGGVPAGKAGRYGMNAAGVRPVQEFAAARTGAGPVQARDREGAAR
jgi:hypothetical protein